MTYVESHFVSARHLAVVTNREPRLGQRDGKTYVFVVSCNVLFQRTVAAVRSEWQRYWEVDRYWIYTVRLEWLNKTQQTSVRP